MQHAVYFTRENFVDFCRKFEEFNFFDFDESAIEESADGQLKYVGTYRDESNYKSPVEFTLSKEGVLSWDVTYGWSDADEEIAELYGQQVEEMTKHEWVVIGPAPDSPPPARRLHCPVCGSKAAETSGDSFHLDEEQFEEQNQFIFEGRVDRFVCACCAQDFYLPETAAASGHNVLQQNMIGGKTDGQ